MLDTAQAKEIAAKLAAVGEVTRMAIVHRLAEGPAHVGRLAEAVGVPMVNMSHHLGVMRLAGLLRDAKDGRRVIYSLNPDVFTPGGANGILGTLQIGTYRMVLAKPKGNAKRKK
jgi:DNA-binding transcriptional ArsR family regulator